MKPKYTWKSYSTGEASCNPLVLNWYGHKIYSLLFQLELSQVHRLQPDHIITSFYSTDTWYSGVQKNVNTGQTSDMYTPVHAFELGSHNDNAMK